MSLIPKSPNYRTFLRPLLACLALGSLLVVKAETDILVPPEPDLFSGIVVGKRVSYRPVENNSEVDDRPSINSTFKAPQTVSLPPQLGGDSLPTLFKLSANVPAADVVVGFVASAARVNRSYSCNTADSAPLDREEETSKKASKRTIAERNYDDWVASVDKADQPNDLHPSIELARFTNANIAIDGHLDEPAWQSVTGSEKMQVIVPDTLENPEFKTCTRIFYTDEGLYVSADMVQPASTLIRRFSARDQELNRDGFTVTIDTSGKGLFGFWFGIGLGGSKEDGKVLPERNFSTEWDGAWQGATALTASGWSAEMFIPWSIIAMPPGETERNMSYFVSRLVAYKNERYGWPALPFTKARFMSAMQPVSMKGVNPKQQWEVFPYATTTADGIYDESKGKAGVNFSWRPAPNMQVTGTVNPDFGAVESDDVVINLTAFETYFPEKRLFFLEGSEVFNTSPRSNTARFSSRGSGARSAPSTWRNEPTTLLNTRRIGGSAKDVTVPDGISIEGPELSKPTELVGAVKMVGQLNAFRYGVLGAMENDVEFRGVSDETGDDVLVTQDGRDFGVARLVWERKIDTGRQAHGFITTFADNPGYQASVHGLDSHFLTQSGKLTIDTQILNSNVDSETGYGAFADIRYTPKQGTTHRVSLDFLDDTIDISDLGFLRRNNLRGFRYARFQNTSKGLSSFVRSRGIGLFSAAQVNSDDEFVRLYVGSGLTYFFTNQGLLNLQTSFRPKMVDDRGSFGNGSYETEPGWYIVLTYGSDAAKKFAYSVQGGLRHDELGDASYIADFGFTVNPIDRLSLDYDIRFTDSRGWVLYDGDGIFNRYQSEQLSHLFSMDYFLTARQQLRATLQWTGVTASEIDSWLLPEDVGKLIAREHDPDEELTNFTISRLTAQVRFRWEIAPMSDFFLVYTRGANLPNLEEAEFGRLFRDALSDPIVDLWVMKLRYRFGS